MTSVSFFPECLRSGRNGSCPIPEGDNPYDDAMWVMTSSFIIFTMQSGFGLLESGLVQSRNEVNIMVKNFMDVICGGIFYWMFGFGISFGDSDWSNPFCGFGRFFLDSSSEDMGLVFSWFIFQLSFATTASTIVSGAMAERTRLGSYMAISVVSVFIYSFPAHWIWDSRGFLAQLGVVDIGMSHKLSGASAVHLVGGSIGLVSTIVLKPRINRFSDRATPMERWSCPTNALFGTFMLWWGWLGFNCGSTFGLTNGRWKLAARSATATLLASMFGGLAGVVLSKAIYKQYRIDTMVNGILTALVSITSLCAVAHPWPSVIIGTIGSLLATATPPVLSLVKIDDPVGVIPVHFVGGIWGTLSVGLFLPMDGSDAPAGLFHGGGFYSLGVQMLTVILVVIWSSTIAFVALKVVERSPLGLRLSVREEVLGCDLVEHGLPYCITTASVSRCSLDRNGISRPCSRRETDSKRNSRIFIDTSFMNNSNTLRVGEPRNVVLPLNCEGQRTNERNDCEIQINNEHPLSVIDLES